MPQKQTHTSSASTSSFPKLCSGSAGLGLTIDTTHVTCTQYRDEEGDTLVQEMKFLLGLEPAKTLEPNFVNRFLTTLFKLRRIPEINHDLLDRICVKVDEVQRKEINRQALVQAKEKRRAAARGPKPAQRNICVPFNGRRNSIIV